MTNIQNEYTENFNIHLLMPPYLCSVTSFYLFDISLFNDWEMQIIWSVSTSCRCRPSIRMMMLNPGFIIAEIFPSHYNRFQMVLEKEKTLNTKRNQSSFIRGSCFWSSRGGFHFAIWISLWNYKNQWHISTQQVLKQ